MRRLITIALTAVVVAAPLGAAHADEPVDPASRMLLVLDSSGSMAEKTPDGTVRIDAAKDALRRVIDKLPDDQEVGLRVYGAEVFSRNDAGACTDSQLIVEPGTDNRDDLTGALDNYKPYGETPIGHALKEAGKDLGSEGPRTIVLVSDGEPTCDPDPCEVAEELSNNGIDVRIDVVGLDVEGAARDKLRCIADKGHGTYYDVDSADALVRSLDVSTTRASRPFDFTGTPITGTPGGDDAPEVTHGVWLDEFPKAEAWYRIPRSTPGSTIHVGLMLLGAREKALTGATATLYDGPTSSARPCGYFYTATGTIGERAPILTSGGQSRPESAGEPCHDADALWLLVKTGGLSSPVGNPVSIFVYEEPPVTADAAESLPEPADDTAWQTLEASTPETGVVPGTSFLNAPIVSEGSYALDINPGETQVIGVPVDWGQSLQAQIDATLTAEIGEAAWIGSGVQIDILTPMLSASSTDLDERPDDWTDLSLLRVQEGTPLRTGAQSLPVAYRHRELSFPTASVPGIHYVRIAYDVRGEDANLPYTLTVKTNGDAGEGAPAYEEIDGLTPPAADSRLVIAGTASADGSVNVAADTSTDEGDSGGPPWLPIGLGAAGALALAAAVLLLLRRRGAAN